jgi:hypothetical protein
MRKRILSLTILFGLGATANAQGAGCGHLFLNWAAKPGRLRIAVAKSELL